jgi:RluA family pseudouridine synthase
MPSRTVHISEKGMRLERFMRIHFPEVPFGMIGGLTKRGKLTIDGGPASPEQLLEPGQVVALPHREKQGAQSQDGRGQGAPGPNASRAQATQKRLDPADRDFLAAITLYEDDDIFVFDKPSGLAVHPGSKITRDLDSLLVRYVPHGAERPVLAHRLDKDTSGVIVAAKRKDVAQKLGKAFETRDVEKEYRAIVAGVPEAGLIDIAIAKEATPRGGRMVAVDPASPGALSAQTRVAIIAAGEGRSHVALFPETGRQHQLRVHMSLTGHPILGDAMYGDASSAPRLMLHAYRLRFKHPAKGWMEVEAPLPEGF